MTGKPEEMLLRAFGTDRPDAALDEVDHPNQSQDRRGPARFWEYVMTAEDPRHTLVIGQVPGQAARARWHEASYRCPCGLATDDASEFDRHLDTADGAEPEHFEVLDGWTFQQVRQWQATTV